MAVNTMWPRRTSRLHLREMEPGDVARIVQIRQLPEVDRWLLIDAVDPGQYREQLLSDIGDPRQHEIVAVREDAVIAHAGITVLDPRAQASASQARGEGGIGYVLDPACAGQGLATEIAEELLLVAFEELDLHRVTSDTLAGNIASWRVLEKIGMRREKHALSSVWHRELGWVDEYEYAILRQEWLRRSEG